MYVKVFHNDIFWWHVRWECKKDRLRSLAHLVLFSFSNVQSLHPSPALNVYTYVFYSKISHLSWWLLSCPNPQLIMSLFDGSILVTDLNPKKPIRLICSLYKSICCFCFMDRFIPPCHTDERHGSCRLGRSREPAALHVASSSASGLPSGREGRWIGGLSPLQTGDGTHERQITGTKE